LQLVEKLRGGFFTNFLYNKITKSKKFLRKAKIIVFLKSGRITEMFGEYDNQKNIILLSEPHPDIEGKNQELLVASKPVIDDATNQPIFFLMQGSRKTFNFVDITNQHLSQSEEDLAFAWYDLGLKEGRSEVLNVALSKKVMLLFVLLFLLLFGVLGLSYYINQNLDLVLKQLNAINSALSVPVKP